MNTVKNAIIASALALVGLFSTAAEARISGDQIEPMTTNLLAAAVSSPNEAFAQCVDQKFYLNEDGEVPPMLTDLNQGMAMRIAAGLVDDEETFAISLNNILKQVCGDSQMAGGGKKSK